MEPLVMAAAAIAGKEIFKKTLNDLYHVCKENFSDKLIKNKTQSQIESIYRNISQVRKVKTIWQVDKTVDILKFYCDSHVIINERRKKISKLSDFNINENIVIQGIAGQGKSILMRYICYNELVIGNYIPIFLELRKVTKDQSLIQRIFTSIGILGITIDDDIFDTLAKSGKILLLLDAFDEIDDVIKKKVLSDIEDISEKYKELKIIITSRHYEYIQMSNHFTVVSLDNLKEKEYQLVINRLSAGKEWNKSLIEHIELNARHIKELLCTPLMVTLLVISYKSFQNLPSKLSDFYDSLFQTLLQRHDGTKPGFKRKRKCALDDNSYRQIFENICIIAKKIGKQSYKIEDIIDITKQAIAECSLKASASNFVDDIVKITCLIIKDGEEHRFIHKTVQEYYTASYIRKKPDPWAKEFYSRIITAKMSKFREWKQEMEFLCEIDSYRYNSLYFIPSVMYLFDLKEDEFLLCKHSFDNIKIANLFMSLILPESDLEKESTSSFLVTTLDITNVNLNLISDTIKHSKVSILKKELNKADKKVLNLAYYKDYQKKNNTFISIGKCIELNIINSFFETAKNRCNILIKNALDARSSINHEENSSLLDGLI